MLTRRTFLRRSFAGAATALAPIRVRAAGQDRPTRSAALPPAIAGLSSMRNEARPIAPGEHLARIGRAQRLMRETRLDAILLPGGTSLTYFTGARWGNSERLMAIVLLATGTGFCVCPAFEELRVREQLARGPLAPIDIRTWQEDESPFVRVAQALRDHGVTSGRLGLEETTKFVFSEGIAKAASTATIASATPVVAGCRMIKDAHELALMRLASTATMKCYEAVYASLAPGMTDTDAGDLVAAAYRRLGFPGSASIQVGEYTALPHGSAVPQTIREGTIIMIDDGCIVEGYQSDLTRTFVLGRSTDDMKRVFDIVSRAQLAALRTARPGVSLASIDAAARRVIVDAGYGPGFKYFTHRVGHGIGMDMHEWPYLVANNMFGWNTAAIAAAGMTFSDEPGVYIPGHFGVRLEDDMVITGSGAELLTAPSTSIEHPFAVA